MSADRDRAGHDSVYHPVVGETSTHTCSHWGPEEFQPGPRVKAGQYGTGGGQDGVSSEYCTQAADGNLGGMELCRQRRNKNSHQCLGDKWEIGSSNEKCSCRGTN